MEGLRTRLAGGVQGWLVFFCVTLHSWRTSGLHCSLYTLITDRLSHPVALCTFARSPPALHRSLSQRSSFSTVFAVFKYMVPSGSYSTSNQASFPIDHNSEVLQDGAGMCSGCDVTFVFSLVPRPHPHPRKSGLVSTVCACA